MMHIYMHQDVHKDIHHDTDMHQIYININKYIYICIHKNLHKDDMHQIYINIQKNT